MSLFDFAPLPSEAKTDNTRPLADRMRPQTLDEYIGQEHILGPGKPLRAQIERKHLSSLILWGPPGSGKTTPGSLLAKASGTELIPFWPVLLRMNNNQVVH